MIDSPEPIDFSPLIQALQKANLAPTFDQQKAEIELALLGAELHPKSSDFCELLWSLELLASVELTQRRWQPVQGDLAFFFAG
jgi:hypothetical protein